MSLPELQASLVKACALELAQHARDAERVAACIRRTPACKCSRRVGKYIVYYSPPRWVDTDTDLGTWVVYRRPWWWLCCGGPEEELRVPSAFATELENKIVSFGLQCSSWTTQIDVQVWTKETIEMFVAAKANKLLVHDWNKVLDGLPRSLAQPVWNKLRAMNAGMLASVQNHPCFDDLPQHRTWSKLRKIFVWSVVCHN
jgi:hypothetical protein